ncbi:rCG25329, isoform CRA_a [Rattus norvegicus]|uniref:RCG25329, isoform CRA_a n=1 Tax=Rattus norvegicus TaxID=10116 RepID=A6I466_RAT|nr:rCG25329, isoform CRA_a [Rattus norvegicus]EDL76811.1 rCG25329, isoform CRA_a [Rattus norvegicus]
MMKDISIKTEPQESVRFEDVAVYFTEQELASFTLDQKALYKEVVLENVAHVAFLGYIAKLRKYAQLAGTETSRVKAFL